MERFHRCLRPLERVVGQFPVVDLYVTIRRHPRSKDYHVTAALHVPSRTLFTGERHDEDAYTALERCVRKLISKVEGHKDQLARKPEHSKIAEGTRQELLPEHEPDIEALGRAAEEGEYRDFREQLEVYYQAARLRVGRWIRRYPQVEARIGETLTIDDIVEEVFLTAFDCFGARPDVRLGQWLESLVHQCVRLLLRKPEAEKENLSLVRTYAGS